MLLLTINYVPGKEIEALGIVKGNVVTSKNIGKDFLAGMKSVVGGELKAYTEMLSEAREISTQRMVKEAEAMNADAVIMIEYSTSGITEGAAELIAYGTAVKYK